jgi:predicted nuclease of predicted toxin-antitoxin system
MARRFYKHKVLLDENMPHRIYFPLTNSRFDIKHIVGDYKRQGLSDPDVYELARKNARLLVTYNIKDFKDLARRSAATGVIGVSPNLPLEQIDKKLTALLTRAAEKELLGKLTIVTGEI